MKRTLSRSNSFDDSIKKDLEKQNESKILFQESNKTFDKDFNSAKEKIAQAREKRKQKQKHSKEYIEALIQLYLLRDKLALRIISADDPLSRKKELELEIAKYIEECLFELKPIIKLMIVDGKLNGKKVTICETGNFDWSGFSGTEKIFEENIDEAVYKKITEIMKNARSIEVINDSDTQETELEATEKIKKWELESNTTNKDITKLTSYCNFLHGNAWSKAPNISTLRDIRKKTIISTDILTDWFNFDKTFLRSLLDSNELTKGYNPKYLKINILELPLTKKQFEIINGFEGKYILIKTPNQVLGNGVYVMLKNSLRGLNQLLQTFNPEKMPYLLIEEIVPSHLIKIKVSENEEEFDATFRSVFAVTAEEGDGDDGQKKIEYHPICTFWKCPTNPFKKGDDDEDIEEVRKKIISSTKKERVISRLSKEDEETVNTELRHAMIELFKTELDFNRTIETRMFKLLNSQIPQNRLEGFNLLRYLWEFYKDRKNDILTKYYQQLREENIKQRDADILNSFYKFSQYKTRVNDEQIKTEPKNFSYFVFNSSVFFKKFQQVLLQEQFKMSPTL